MRRWCFRGDGGGGAGPRSWGLALIVVMVACCHAEGAGGHEPEDDFFPPEVVLQLLGSEEPQTPPLTHHLDIELRSFDPAEGYMEVWSGDRMMKRILDPPPVEIFTVYVAAGSCVRPAKSCGGSYTVRLFLFSRTEPVAAATAPYQLLPTEAPPPPPPPPPRSDEEGASAEQEKEESEELSPELAASVWPLPCKHIVQFPGFPPPSSYLQRPLIILAYPPHDLVQTRPIAYT